jgi:hypothetical protein
MARLDDPAHPRATVGLSRPCLGIAAAVLDSLSVLLCWEANEGKISTEIRITRTTADPNALTVGCVFLDPGPDTAVVKQVWTRLHGPT